MPPFSLGGFMYVVFAMLGENENFPVIPRGNLMVASVRRYLPDAKIIQLTNQTFAALENIDEVYRCEYRGDFIEWGFRAVIDILKRGEPMLQIATDVLLQGDVSSIFDHEFDNAACRYPLRDRPDGAFCGDVNFIKPSGLKFWEDVYEYYINSPTLFGTWEGGQSAFLEIANAMDHKILALPYDEYCYTPEDFDEDISKAKIIHFRGNRKGMMHYYAMPMKLLMPFTARVVGNVPDRIMEDNCRYNLGLEIEILAAQYQYPRHKELLIVGGGPSLKDCLWEISLKQEGGAEIWALNNAFHYLCEHGIEPDAQILLDARLINQEFVPQKTDALLLYSAQCHPAVIAKGKEAGKVILWCPSIAPIVDILNEKKKLAAVIAGGSSVGMKALGLAHLFGFKHVHLYGYDSSYRNGENHAYKQSINNNENFVEVILNGKPYISAPWMVTQTQDFQHSLPNFIAMGLQIYVHGDGLLPDMARAMV
jgi:Protein of unknown function DUF115